MRCFSCGEHLEGNPEVCPRCLTRLTPDYIRRHLTITVIYAAVSIAVIAVFCLIVVNWHDAQLRQLLAEQGIG